MLLGWLQHRIIEFLLTSTGRIPGNSELWQCSHDIKMKLCSGLLRLGNFLYLQWSSTNYWVLPTMSYSIWPWSLWLKSQNNVSVNAKRCKYNHVFSYLLMSYKQDSRIAVQLLLTSWILTLNDLIKRKNIKKEKKKYKWDLLLESMLTCFIWPAMQQRDNPEMHSTVDVSDQAYKYIHTLCLY